MGLPGAKDHVRKVYVYIVQHTVSCSNLVCNILSAMFLQCKDLGKLPKHEKDAKTEIKTTRRILRCLFRHTWPLTQSSVHMIYDHFQPPWPSQVKPYLPMEKVPSVEHEASSRLRLGLSIWFSNSNHIP